MNGCITLVGGAGFIGRALAQRLADRGHAVRIIARRVEAVGDTAMERVAGDIRDGATAAWAVDGARAIVNLVGTTAAESEAAFFELHCEAPRRLAEAAQRAGVQRFVQVSAMGVARDAPAAADRSKAAGEEAVRGAFPGANVVRPALVFGPGDHFFTRFAALVRSAPAIPLIGGGHTRFQPMHVADVAETIARVLETPATRGRTFELGGAEIFTFRELIERLSRALGRRPRLVPIPFAVAEAGAFATQWLPGAPLTVDQVRLLKTDKIISDPQNAPETLGITPRPLARFLEELAAGLAGN